MSVSDFRKCARIKEDTMSQRCHEHIREVRHRIAAVVIHTVVDSVHKAGIDHKELAEQSRKEADFVHRLEVCFGRTESGSGRRV